MRHLGESCVEIKCGPFWARRTLRAWLAHYDTYDHVSYWYPVKGGIESDYRKLFAKILNAAAEKGVGVNLDCYPLDGRPSRQFFESLGFVHDREGFRMRWTRA